MANTVTRRPEFAYITRLTKHGTKYAACGGIYNRVLIAERSSAGGVTFLGQSALLTSAPLDIVSNGTPSAYYVLTALGITTLSAASAPAITAESVFKTGGHPWLVYTAGGNLLAPLAGGGVRLQTTAGVVLQELTGILSESSAAVLSGGVLYVFDSVRGKMAAVTVTATGLTYEGTFDAPNCREVVRATIDGTNLYCLNRHRVVRFSIAAPLVPVLTQDYGRTSLTYTDIVVIGSNKVWCGFATITEAQVGDLFFGPTFGVWDVTNSELHAAASLSSAWTVNTDIPYFTSSGFTPAASTPSVLPVASPLLAAVRVNNRIYASAQSGQHIYLVGDFTTVTDNNGTYARGGAAKLNTFTGLFESWNVATGGGRACIHVGDDGFVYIGSATVATQDRIARVDAVTGVRDATWAPTVTGGTQTVHTILKDGALVHLGGSFLTVNGTSRSFMGTVDASGGGLNAFRPQSPDGARFIAGAAVNTIRKYGGSLWIFGQGTDIINTAGSLYFGIGLIKADATTGVVASMPNGFASLSDGALHVDGTVYLVGDLSTGVAAFTAPMPPYTPYLLRTKILSVATSGVITAFAPDVTASAFGRAVISDPNGDVFACGDWATVNGNGIRTVSKFSGSAIDATFAPVWSGAADAFTLQVAGNCLMVAGNWSVTTINGQLRNFLTFLNKLTGALY